MKTHVTIKLDANVRAELEPFCEEIGMSLSTAINILARSVVRNQRLPDAVAGIPDNQTDGAGVRTNILIDQDARDAFSAICKSSHTNMTSVVNRFMRVVIRDRRFPLELSIDPL